MLTSWEAAHGAAERGLLFFVPVSFSPGDVQNLAVSIVVALLEKTLCNAQLVLVCTCNIRSQVFRIGFKWQKR